MSASESVPEGREAGGVMTGAVRSRATARWLFAFAVGYNLAHHNSLVGAAAGPDGTRVADWVDLATPFVVALPLLGFLAAQRPPRQWLGLGAVGALLYTEGHGIHLSANSIGNTAPDGGGTGAMADVAHLWDEVVGHYLWYAGLAILLAACALALRGRRLGLPVPALVAGGAVSGLTWATNGLEGGTAVFSLVCAVAAAVGLVDRRRWTGLSVATASASVVAAAVLAGYGIAHGGFPQPSSL